MAAQQQQNFYYEQAEPLVPPDQQPESDGKHPLLAWTQQGRHSKEERIRNVVQLLRSPPMRMSVPDLLCSILSRDLASPKARGKFMTSERHINLILDAISEDSEGAKILDRWLLNKSGYAMGLYCSTIDKEMESVKPDLRADTKDLTPELLLGFKPEDRLPVLMRDKAPVLDTFLRRAAESDHAIKNNTKKYPDNICAAVFAQLCYSRSRKSNLFQQATGIFLYGLGAPKLVVEFMSGCGLSTSFSTILNAHGVLSEKLIGNTSEVAKGPHMLAFDNEQISMSTHMAQRPGATPMVHSFTTGILYSLKRATLEACRLDLILEQRKIAPLITYENHILSSHSEMRSIAKHFATNIVIILMENTDSDNFNPDDYAAVTVHEAHRPPQDNDKVTKEYVLRTVEIDESRIIGCIQVTVCFYKDQLKISDEILKNLAILCVNDQLTNSRMRAALKEREGDLTPFERMECFQIGPGLFHLQMNLGWHILFIHKGNETTPGSLAFYAKYLNYQRVMNERPDFYTLRSFLFQVLTANILSAWSLKTGFIDFSDYLKASPNPTDVFNTALDILKDFASEEALENCDESDILLRNTILLNRDLLYYFELDSAISSGDFGRIEIILGPLASMFNGSGGKNYCNEILHLIQNLKSSWPTEFANVMRDNLLISIRGHDGHFMGVDLNIEHNINLQKKFFSGRGVHGTAEHLAEISPVTVIYQDLRRSLCHFANVPYYGTNHTTPSTATNVGKLMKKIEETSILGPQDANIDRGTEYTQVKDILKIGGLSLKQTGMKAFHERYRDWANREDNDETGIAENKDEDNSDADVKTEDRMELD